MMKKICLLVAFFVLGKMWSYAQYPITQTLGSDSTIVISKGALQSRLINVTYTDTTAANLQRIRQYPGAQIATTTGGLNLWVRNANATAWIPVATGSGNNIYTIDGTLLGNRTLAGAGYSLTFNQLSKLLFNADSTTVNTDQATILNNGLSTLSVKGAGARTLLIDTTAPADERIYELKSSNGEFYISILNDAQTSNDSAFLITSASRVGINTLNPDSTLKVGGGVNILGGLRVGNLPTSPGTKQLRINAQGQLSVTDTLIDAGGTVTSVGTNNGSGIIGGPITTTGTLAIDTTNVIATKASVSGGLAGKLNISDTASMLSPYLRSNSAAATYVPLTRTLTINGTTQDLSANRTYNVGTVTSVGLTMPAAFNVANSPVTSSGTLAVTGAGLVSQYIRGDGTLADFPGGGGGGGASISYYLNGSVNQGTFGGNTYYEMNKVPIFGAGTNFSINADGYIAQFITDAGDPGLLNIPAGNWNFELFFNASSSGGSPTYYVELYKYDGTTFTLIASGSTNPDAITGGTSVDAYFSTLPVPQTILTLTDRLAVRIYVTHSGRTITLHTEDNNLCQIITTFTTGITALNGLTEQVQYFTTGTSGTDFNISSSVATHTFNLPTASATNRGALSTTDWTTFNSKLSPADTVSLSNRINLKLNISDTASMLGNYLNNVGYGLSKAGQVASADSATLSAYYLRRKDSLTATNPLGYVTKKILSDTAAAIRSSDLGGTVTSVATNNGTGITGGTITTSGTLAIDTLLVSTRAWRQKGVDSVAALANTKISGSLISGYLTKATGSLTIDTSQIYQNGQNVGIGTIVPDGRLAIVDTGGFALKIMYNSASTDANTNAALYAENNGLSSYVTIFNEKTTNNTGGQFPLLVESSLTSGTAQSGMATGIHFGVPDDAGNRKVTQLALRTTDPAAATYTNRAELRLWNAGSLSTPYYLLGNGNMGLGTSTPDSNLTVVNGALFQRGVRMSGLPQAPGTKALRIDASGTISYADTLIDAGGTVTSVATNNGSGITGGTITTSGTIAADTLLLSTRAWRQKGIDSVASLINTAISGTTNYIPKFTSSSAIGNSVIYESSSNIGIGTTTTNRLLTIKNSSDGVNGIAFQSYASTAELGYIRYEQTNDFLDLVNTSAFAGGGIKFSTNSTERLRISSTGNVSIGGTTASSIFNINGVDPLISFQNGGTTKWQVGLENTSSDRFIWYNNAGAAYRMILDASGNLGLGVSPSNAFADSRSFEIGANGILWSEQTSSIYNSMSIGSNFYYNAAGSTLYKNTGVAASRFTQYQGSHIWFQAPSGTAGNAISFTQAMTLDASGRLGIGTTSPLVKLDVYSTTADATNNPGNSQIRASASSTKWLSVGYDATINAGYLQGAESGQSWRPIILNLNGTTTSPVLIGQSTSDGVSKLQVTGAATFSSSVTSSNFYIPAGSAGTFGLADLSAAIQTYSGSVSPTNSLLFYTSASERMRITSGGNVGIGTTSPSTLLEVAGVIRGASLNVYGSTDPASTSPYLYSPSTGALGIGANGSERMRITSGGNVGIGTSSPQVALDVINSGTYQLRVATGTGNYSNGKIYFGGYATGDPYYYGTIGWDQSDVTMRIGAQCGNATGGIAFYTSASTAAQTERMRITSGGNVGIGTTSPSELLDVRNSYREPTSGEFTQLLSSITTQDAGRGGSLGFGGFTNGTSGYTTFSGIKGFKENGDGGNTAGALAFYTRVNGGAITERMRITSGGNVGIGTTSPATPLAIKGANNNTLIEMGNFSTNSAFIQSYDRTSSVFRPFTMYADLFTFETGGSERMRITSGGELLVNTTTDAGAYYLQVNGDVYAGAYYESSDRRLKDILSVRGGSDGINTVTFKWKDQRDSLSHIGYIAQEVEKVLPDAVKTNPNGYKTVNYDEVQTLKIANLEQEIAELKKIINQLIDKK